MKILIIRFSSIGDIVLTTPVIRCIKQQRPDSSIHFLVKKSFRDVVAFNPYLDKIHDFDGDLEACIEELRNERFDIIVDMHKNLRSMRIRKALGKKTYSFDKLNVAKWAYVNLKWDLMPDKSIVDRYFEGLSSWGIRNDGQGLDFFIPEHMKTHQEDIPMGHWAGYVGCVIGGSYETKKFPVDKWKDFVGLCPYPIVLLGGPEDKAEGEEIRAADPSKVYNACGKFGLLESADLVKRARVLVTNDTGLMHIGAAFQKPIVSLWGNTTPRLGMFPYYGFNNLNKNVSRLSSIIENNELGCRPCSKIGFHQCPKKHFKCMRDLPIRSIIEKVQELWGR